MTDQPAPFVPANLLADRADMRIEVVKRELNQGALAGFDSAVTDYAARLVVAALDSYDATALTEVYNRGVKDGKVLQAVFGSSIESLQAEWERGVAEGRRQATEGWDREWGLSLHGHPAQCVMNEHAARGIAADPSAPADTKVLSRLAGPWEPTEQPTEQPTAPSHGPGAPRHGYDGTCGEDCDNRTCPLGANHDPCTAACVEQAQDGAR